MSRFRIVENYHPCVKHVSKTSMELIEIKNLIYKSTKTIKYLGINLTTYIQDLYAENCETPKEKKKT